jgi:signal transduction histidine kinase
MSDEAKRINELRKYNILDTLTEKDYDDVTFLASVICDVPIALISFVDEDRQWFKSHLGLAASETLREYSFCSHAIKFPQEIMIVEDSRIDERFKDNPLVTGDPNIVFYAGIPLINEGGFGLGTVCIIDTKTRTLNDNQIKALKILSTQVMHLLKLRKVNSELELLKLELETRNKDLEQFAMVVSHDIKSPLSTIILVNTMLKENAVLKIEENFNNLISISSNSANKIKTFVDGILSYYKADRNIIELDRIDINEFFESLRNTITSTKEYKINYATTISHIFFNKVQLEQIFYNLINNSIRYSDKETVQIDIKLAEDNDFYKFIFSDNGIGISEENYKKIFELFTTLSSVDNFGLKGSGIGLSTIKKIIENAQGTISVESELGKGTSFIFKIKK